MAFHESRIDYIQDIERCLEVNDLEKATIALLRRSKKARLKVFKEKASRWMYQDKKSLLTLFLDNGISLNTPLSLNGMLGFSEQSRLLFSGVVINSLMDMAAYWGKVEMGQALVTRGVCLLEPFHDFSDYFLGDNFRKSPLYVAILFNQSEFMHGVTDSKCLKGEARRGFYRNIKNYCEKINHTKLDEGEVQFLNGLSELHFLFQKEALALSIPKVTPKQLKSLEPIKRVRL